MTISGEMKAFIIVVILSFSAHSTRGFELRSGLLTVGGNLSFPLEYNHLDVLTLKVNVQPSVGFFVKRNWEIMGFLKLVSQNKSLLNWNLGFGTQYYFDQNWAVIPFIGAQFSVGMNNLILQTVIWSLAAPIGILILLNEYVALDVAIRTELKMNGQTLFSSLVFTPGYFGLRAFF